MRLPGCRCPLRASAHTLCTGRCLPALRLPGRDQCSAAGGAPPAAGCNLGWQPCAFSHPLPNPLCPPPSCRAHRARPSRRGSRAGGPAPTYPRCPSAMTQPQARQTFQEEVDFDESEFFGDEPAAGPAETAPPQPGGTAASDSDEGLSDDDGLVISDCSSDSDAEDAVEEHLRLRLQSLQSSLDKTSQMEGAACARAGGRAVAARCRPLPGACKWLCSWPSSGRSSRELLNCGSSFTRALTPPRPPARSRAGHLARQPPRQPGGVAEDVWQQRAAAPRLWVGRRPGDGDGVHAGDLRVCHPPPARAARVVGRGVGVQAGGCGAGVGDGQPGWLVGARNVFGWRRRGSRLVGAGGGGVLARRQSCGGGSSRRA